MKLVKALSILLLMASCSYVHCQDEPAASVASILSVQDLKTSIISADGILTSSNSGQYPAALLANPQIPPKHSLEVTLTPLKDGSETKPQQVMLMLTHKASGAAAYAVGKAKKGSYTLSVSAASVEKQLGRVGGEFEVTLLVGDPAVPKGFKWSLGVVELVVPNAISTPTIRTASLQPVNNRKPHIEHMFRPAEKRPPAAVSLAFTGFAVAPLVATVLVVLGVVKVNFKGFPVDAATGLAALLFHGSIAAMLGLYFMFYLKLNLAQTLPLVAVIGIVIALTGYKALSGLASARLKKD